MKPQHSELEDRISAMLKGVPHVTKRMFGGLCYMVRGNMLVGTFRDGMMARVAKQDHAKVLKIAGASEMVMKGRVMEGFILISQASVTSSAAMKKWIDMALAYNATLPAKAVKPAKRPAKKAKTPRK
jgi:TfoX/Sxy family transcriptional regulator of competence genes